MSKTIKQIWKQLNSSDNTALWENGRYLTYHELGIKTKSIAHTLQALSLHQQAVGIFTNRCAETYAGILATLGSGNVFLPLNTMLPISRICEILRDAHCTTILASDADKNRLKEVQKELPDLKIIWQSETSVPSSLEKHTISIPSDTKYPDFTLTEGYYAYILFTSGSTGKPKGIAITHDQLNQYIGYLNLQYHFSSDDRFSQHADITFDLSVHDWALAFSNGASLYVVPELLKSCPVDFINEHQLTCWLSVPSVISLANMSGRLQLVTMPSLRLSFFAGQALPVSSAKLWYAASHSRIINLYGPTEGTIAIASHEWDPQRDYLTPSVPIGKVFSTQQSYLDIHDGQTGELWVTGSQVIESYWENPEANRKAFTGREGQQWYKTGDLVSRQPDGEYYFIGRTDHQVKIQGYRIELGEIESVARQLGVESVAVPWPLDKQNTPKGIALVVCSEDSDQSAELHTYFRQKLPKYMQPHRIKMVSAIPLNLNGKVDIKALQNILDK